MKKLFLRVALVCCVLFSQVHAEWAEQIIKTMTLDEKIGQLIMISARASDQEASTESLVEKYQVGSIICFQYQDSLDQVQHVNKLQNLSKLPLLVAQDCEWGLSMRVKKAVEFPRNMTLGALQNNELVYALGLEIGRQCRAVGVHVNFAPVIDTNSNPKNPIIGTRSFGARKENVAQKAECIAQGFKERHVIACAKHFPGHGDTDVDSHLALPVLNHTRERIEAEELYPFKKLIAAKIPSVMIAHMAIPALDTTPNLPSSLSYEVVTGLLRNQLGFEGLVFTDALNMKGVSSFFTPAQSAKLSLLAGNDVLVMPPDVGAAFAGIQDAVRVGEISEELITARVLKILQTKESLGLHTSRLVSEDGLNERLWTNKSLELKRELYRNAVTLVRDQENILAKPIAGGSIACVHVGGAASDMLAQRCGRYLHVPVTASIEEFSAVHKQLEDYEAIVLVISQVDAAGNRYGRVDRIAPEIEQFFDELLVTDKKIITLVGMSLYVLSYLKNHPTIVLSYDSAPDALEAGLDVITGQLNPCGILPV